MRDTTPGKRPLRPSVRARHTLRVRHSYFHIPIAMKYAFITGILLVLFMIFLGRTLLNLSLEAAERQINDQGIKAALLVAARTEPFWIDETLSNEERIAAQERLNRELKACLQDPGAQGLLDILIMDSKGTEFYASAREGRQVNLGEEREILSIEASRASSVRRSSCPGTQWRTPNAHTRSNRWSSGRGAVARRSRASKRTAGEGSARARARARSASLASMPT